MTRPKKWHLHKQDNEVILRYSTGPIKKPNATESLGAIKKVYIPPKESIGKLSERDAILVSIAKLSP